MTIKCEFWISCDKCGEERCIVETVPGARHTPRNQREAFNTAKSIGWTGIPIMSLCPECSCKGGGKTSIKFGKGHREAEPKAQVKGVIT